MGQMQYLTVSIPDLCKLNCFYETVLHTLNVMTEMRFDFVTAKMKSKCSIHVIVKMYVMR